MTLRRIGRSPFFALLLGFATLPVGAHERTVLPLGDETLVPLTFEDLHVELSAEWADPDGGPELDLGVLEVGESTTASVAIRNISVEDQTVEALLEETVSWVSLDGAGPTLLRAGAETFLLVTYAPSELGEDLAASLRVTATDAEGFSEEHLVELTARVVDGGPLITVDPESFDLEILDGSSPTLAFDVTNLRSVELAVTAELGTYVGSDPWLVFDPSQLELGAGATVPIGFSFRAGEIDPPAPMEITATTPTGVSEVVTIPLAVVVTRDYGSVAPESLDFGEVELGSALTLPVAVSNTSRGPVSVRVLAPVDQPVALGEGDDEFELPVDGVRQVQVTYAPTSADHPPLTRLTVVVTNEDGFEDQLSVDLVGEVDLGEARLIAFRPFTSINDAISAIDFGQVVANVGAAYPTDVVLFNVGNAATEGAEVQIPGLDAATGCAGTGTGNELCLLQWLGGEVFQPLTGLPELEPDEGIQLRVIWSPASEGLSPPGPMTVFGGSEPLDLGILGLSVPSDQAVVQLIDPDQPGNPILTDLLLDEAEREGTETLIRNFVVKNLGEAQTIGRALGLDPLTSCLPDAFQNKCFYAAADGEPLAQYLLQAGEEKEAVVYWLYSPDEAEDREFHLSFTNSIDDPDPQIAPLTVYAKSEGETPGEGGDQGPNGEVAYPDEFGGARGLINENAFFSDLEIDTINKLNGNLVVALPLGTPWQVGPSFSYGLSAVFNSSSWLQRTGADFSLPDSPVTNGTITIPFPTNVALGWHVNLGGELYAGTRQLPDPPVGWPGESNNPFSAFDWIYIDGSGGQHPLRGNGSSFSETLFSHDDTNLRIREISPTRVFVDLPSGLTQEFHRYTGGGCPADAAPAWCWRLKEIVDPFGNWVRFDYSTPNRTVITDIHGDGDPDRRITVKYVDLDTGGEGFQTFATKHVDAIEFPSTADHAGPATWDFVLDRKTITRACPVDESHFDEENYSEHWDVTVHLLKSIVLPGDNGGYSFVYDETHEPAESCHQWAGALQKVTSPLGGKLEYEYNEGVDLPIPCPEEYDYAPGEVEVSRASIGVTSRKIVQVVGEEDEEEGGDDQLVSWRRFRYQLVDKLIEPEVCGRANTMETHVAEMIPAGEARYEGELHLRYRHEVHFHNVTKSDGSGSQSDVGPSLPPGDWRLRDYGLPIAKSRSRASRYGAGTPELYLSSVVLDCTEPITYFKYNEPNYTAPGPAVTPPPEIPAACRVHREEYQRYAYKTTDCFDQASRFGSCTYRARALSGRQQRFFKAGGEIQYQEEKHTDFDGFGTFRETTVRSNLGGPTLQTWDKTNTFVFDGNEDEWFQSVDYDADSTFVGAFPGRGGVGPWLFGLYDSKQSDPDGAVRHSTFDFAPTGFLECQRTYAAFGEPADPEEADLTVEYHPATAGGWTERERWAGGDGVPSGDCGRTPQIEIAHEHSMGQVVRSVYVDGGTEVAPPMVDHQLDPATGLVRESCDRSVSPPLCRTFHYDLLGRVETEGDEASGRGLERTFEYSLEQPGGIVTILTEEASGGGALIGQTELEVDALGRDRTVRRRISPERTDPRLDPDGAPDWIVQTKGYRRGRLHYVSGVFDEDLWSRSPAARSKSQYRFSEYDIHGRVLAFDPPRIDEEIDFGRNQGAVGWDVSWINMPGDDTEVRTDTRKDHLGRLVRVEEDKDFENRVTTTSYSNGSTKVQRTDPGLGVTQYRERRVDGRGFLVWEYHPEKRGPGEEPEDARVGYTYDSRGKVKSVDDKGVAQAFVYDRAERLLRIHLGTVDGRLLEEHTYYGVSDSGLGAAPGRLKTATRYNYFTPEETGDENGGDAGNEPTGYAAAFLREEEGEAVLRIEVRDTYLYDDEGRVEDKATFVELLALDADLGFLRLIAFGELSAQWAYDGAGRVTEVTYPHCEDQTGLCGFFENAGLRDLRLRFTYDVGELVLVEMSDAPVEEDAVYRPLLRYRYHPTGSVRERVRYDLDGEYEGFDEILEYVYSFGNGTLEDPDLTLPRVGRITVWDWVDDGIPLQNRWDSDDYAYDVRAQIASIGTTWSYTYDRLGRLATADGPGPLRTYSYDDFDNLLDTDTASFTIDPVNNRLATALAGFTAVHDSRGNLTGACGVGGCGFNARYDPFGRQSAFWLNYDIDPPGGPDQDETNWDFQAMYAYSADGERVVTLARLPEDLLPDESYPTGVEDPAPDDCGPGTDGCLNKDFSEVLVTFYGGGAPLREFRLTDEITDDSSRSYASGVRSMVGQEASFFEGSDGTGVKRYQLRHLTTDHLGSVRYSRKYLLADDGSSQEGSRIGDSYTPWGDTADDVGGSAIGEAYGYAGHMGDRNALELFEGEWQYAVPRDGQISSINMKARSYLPDLGRFLSVDPARDPSSWSLYAYASNDPINRVDPTGLADDEPDPDGGTSTTTVDGGGKNKLRTGRQLYLLRKAGVDLETILTLGGVLREDNFGLAFMVLGAYEGVAESADQSFLWQFAGDEGEPTYEEDQIEEQVPEEMTGAFKLGKTLVPKPSKRVPFGLTRLFGTVTSMRNAWLSLMEGDNEGFQSHMRSGLRLSVEEEAATYVLFQSLGWYEEPAPKESSRFVDGLGFVF